VVNEKQLSESLKFMEKEMKGLAQASYLFENVVVPRANADKAILEQMQMQYKKLEAMLTKVSAGEELSNEEIVDAIPEQFR